jgi:hypothetical protein
MNAIEFIREGGTVQQAIDAGHPRYKIREAVGIVLAFRYPEYACQDTLRDAMLEGIRTAPKRSNRNPPERPRAKRMGQNHLFTNAVDVLKRLERMTSDDLARELAINDKVASVVMLDIFRGGHCLRERMGSSKPMEYRLPHLPPRYIQPPRTKSTGYISQTTVARAMAIMRERKVSSIAEISELLGIRDKSAGRALMLLADSGKLTRETGDRRLVYRLASKPATPARQSVGFAATVAKGSQGTPAGENKGVL